MKKHAIYTIFLATIFSANLFFMDDAFPNSARISEILTVGRQNVSSIAELQELLTQQGYDVGPIDGVMGPKTRTAIKSWFQANRTKLPGLEDSVEQWVIPNPRTHQTQNSLAKAFEKSENQIVFYNSLPRILRSKKSQGEEIYKKFVDSIVSFSSDVLAGKPPRQSPLPIVHKVKIKTWMIYAHKVAPSRISVEPDINRFSNVVKGVISDALNKRGIDVVEQGYDYVVLIFFRGYTQYFSPLVDDTDVSFRLDLAFVKPGKDSVVRSVYGPLLKNAVGPLYIKQDYGIVNESEFRKILLPKLIDAL